MTVLKVVSVNKGKSLEKEVGLSIANPWGSPWGNSSGSMWVSVFNRVPSRLNRSYGWPQKINNLVTGEKFALVVSTRKHYRVIRHWALTCANRIHLISKTHRELFCIFQDANER